MDACIRECLHACMHECHMSMSDHECLCSFTPKNGMKMQTDSLFVSVYMLREEGL